MLICLMLGTAHVPFVDINDVVVTGGSTWFIGRKVQFPSPLPFGSLTFTSASVYNYAITY